MRNCMLFKHLLLSSTFNVIWLYLVATIKCSKNSFKIVTGSSMGKKSTKIGLIFIGG